MPYADDWDEAGEIPIGLWPKAAEVGLLGLSYPEAYGGTPGDVWLGQITAEELGRIGAGGINASLMVHNIGLPPIINWGSQAMKDQIAPPILRGEANYVSTAVRTGGEGAGGVSMLLIPTDAEGFSRTPLDRKQGWWASDTATLYFDNVRVPATQLIGEENQGFRVIMTNFNSERMGMAIHMEAAARVCMAEAVSWARERRTFGKRLGDHQVIRHKIAMMKQKLNATQAYIRVCNESIERGEPNPADIALLKVQASEVMEFCAREAMQVLGGLGFMRGSRTERIYREVRVNAIGGGSEEIMRDLASRQYGL